MEFHEMRRLGIGSSDAPVIMKISPWKTPFQLWEEKLGLRTIETSNYATERGNAMEPKARAHYELLNDMDMPPMLVEHQEFPYMRASLDGCNLENKIILEIKCPSAKDHAAAVAGTVPEKYWPQVQHQLLVTGFERLHYFSFDGEGGALVEVKPDLDYISMLFEAEKKFWQSVQSKTAPAFCDGDFKSIRKKGLTETVRNWRKLFEMMLLECGDTERAKLTNVLLRKVDAAVWEIHLLEEEKDDG